MPDTTKPRRLESWKAIAQYLGREVRTVQRWEKDAGLPVHRLEHTKLASVFAHTDELDTWMASRHAAPTVSPSEGVAAAPTAHPLEDVAAAPVVRAPEAAATPLPAHPPEPLPPPLRTSKPGRPAWAVAVCVALLLAFASVWAIRLRAPAPHVAAGYTLRTGRIFAQATGEHGRQRLIPVGRDPQFAVLAAQGKELYVSNAGSNTVSIIATADDTVTATLPVASVPGDMAVTPDGGLVFVGDVEDGTVSVIRTADHSLRTIALPGRIQSLAMSPDGRSVYVAMPYAGLVRIDTATLAATSITTSPCPATLAFAPASPDLFVGYQCGGPGGRSGHDVIGVLSPAGVLQSVLGGDVPMVGNALAVTPAAGQVWADSGNACISAEYDHAGCLAPSTLYIFNPATGKLARRIAIPDPFNSIQFFGNGTRVLMTGGGSSTVLDATRLTALERVPAVNGRGAFSSDGQRLYLPLPDRDRVEVFTAASTNCDPPLDNLLGWWPGDGSPGDAVGLDDARPSPGVTYVPALVGQGFALDGASTIDFGQDWNWADDGLNDLTFAFWMKASGDQPGAVVMDKTSADGKLGWRLAISARHRLAFSGPAEMEGDTAVQPGRWYHVALSLGSNRVQLHLDGRMDGQAALPIYPRRWNAELVAGGGAPGMRHFAGVLDEIVVYSGVLQAATLGRLLAAPACVQ